MVLSNLSKYTDENCTKLCTKHSRLTAPIEVASLYHSVERRSMGVRIDSKEGLERMRFHEYIHNRSQAQVTLIKAAALPIITAGVSLETSQKDSRRSLNTLRTALDTQLSFGYLAMGNKALYLQWYPGVA